MKNNKRVIVYMVIALLFVVQVVAVGMMRLGYAETFGAVAPEMESSHDVIGHVAVGEETAPAEQPATVSEEAQVELSVVYRNTLTQNGQIVDDLDAASERSDFADKVISYCEARITVHESPDAASPVVGCMYSRSQGDILERGEYWTKISSGNVVGYVKNTSLLFGAEADKVAPLLGKRTTHVTVSELKVYSTADYSSEVIAVFYEGDEINALEEQGSWVLVECDGGFGYVDETGVMSTYDLASAWTIEEESAYLAELARIEAERIAAERAAAAKLAQAQSQAVGMTTNDPMYVSDSEAYLLACIIEWEAGWEPYEGKLAVANVVLNRVRSSRFKQNTITDVIYAPGQFSGVLDGNGNISQRFADLMANGPKHSDCYTAAGEALAGVNNIGDYLFFISIKKANYGRYNRYTIINNHCFYLY